MKRSRNEKKQAQCFHQMKTMLRIKNLQESSLRGWEKVNFENLGDSILRGMRKSKL